MGQGEGEGSVAVGGLEGLNDVGHTTELLVVHLESSGVCKPARTPDPHTSAELIGLEHHHISRGSTLHIIISKLDTSIDISRRCEGFHHCATVLVRGGCLGPPSVRGVIGGGIRSGGGSSNAVAVRKGVGCTGLTNFNIDQLRHGTVSPGLPHDQSTGSLLHHLIEHQHHVGARAVPCVHPGAGKPPRRGVGHPGQQDRPVRVLRQHARAGRHRRATHSADQLPGSLVLELEGVRVHLHHRSVIPPCHTGREARTCLRPRGARGQQHDLAVLEAVVLGRELRWVLGLYGGDRDTGVLALRPAQGLGNAGVELGFVVLAELGGRNGHRCGEAAGADSVSRTSEIELGVHRCCDFVWVSIGQAITDGVYVIVCDGDHNLNACG
mmetsp:Transcript_117303/g.269459  ORF Transcript_117303/g.269459 Transcript_117303/m.269459 type:complete len:381 (-) Transcript_117303:1632-2774(-)